MGICGNNYLINYPAKNNADSKSHYKFDNFSNHIDWLYYDLHYNIYLDTITT